MGLYDLRGNPINDLGTFMRHENSSLMTFKRSCEAINQDFAKRYLTGSPMPEDIRAGRAAISRLLDNKERP